MDSRHSFFRSRSDTFHSRSLYINRRLKLLAFLRVLVFVISLVAILIFANNSNLIGIILVAVGFLPVFSILVKWYNNAQYRMNHNRFLSRINEEELLRLDGTLEGFDPGIEYIDSNHAYHNDLDIFGNNSVYQLINRCSTSWGKQTLSSWLSSKASREEIMARQHSVKELANKIEWIQEFQATGLHYENKSDIGNFLKWLGSGQQVSTRPVYNIVRFLGPVIMMTLLTLIILSTITFHWIILGVLINALTIMDALSKVKNIHENTSEALKTLKSLEQLIVLTENMSFESEKLRHLQSVYLEGRKKVSKRIKELNVILQNLDNRTNQIYHLFNIVFLLDLHYAYQAEKWKEKQKHHTESWFKTIGEMEGLISLAGMAFANPSYNFPVILEGSHRFKAENMGHPLIPGVSRVSNSFSISGRGSIAMITGSNMAGKSTFLRTVGVNMVLAYAGSVVCANTCSLTIAQVFSSMRTQDNLEENISSFYAELNRIQALLGITSEQMPVFFLLDEILKGTNSHDRHLGAVSLVRQLASENTSGLISTHDIDLAREATNGAHVTNFSFNSTIKGDEIHFDYRLSQGICNSFNASTLMQKMGIKIIEPPL